MRIEKSFNKRDTAISSINSVYSIAKISGMNSSELNSEVRRIKQENLKGCPQWIGSYVDGYVRCLQEFLYKECLVFGGYYKGGFYSTHSNRDDYYGKHGISPIQWYENSKESLTGLGHYWVTTETPKPYFV